jgi:hypothetical protein
MSSVRARSSAAAFSASAEPSWLANARSAEYFAFDVALTSKSTLAGTGVLMP